MSIKIDLLPGYVGLRRWFRRSLWISAALLSSVATVLFVLWYKDKQNLEKVNIEYENMAANEQAAIAAKAAAEVARGEAVPIDTAVKFFVEAGQTGVKRAAMLDLVSRYVLGPGRGSYTNPDNYGAVVTSIDLSDGQSLKMQATVSSIETYQSFLLNMRLGSATYPFPYGTLFPADPRSNNVVPGSGPPGYSSKIETIIPPIGFSPQVVPLAMPFSFSAPLKTPLTVPTEPK